MKPIYLLILSLVAVVGALAQSPAGEPRTYVVAIAPGISGGKGNAVLKACFDLALNRAQAGENIEFLNGLDLTRLVLVHVPNGTARERANSPEFAGKFGALKDFLSIHKPDDARLAGQVRVPQLLDLIANEETAHRNISILIVGSPLFRTIQPKEEAFNMDGGLIPGDGMISATRAESLFGTSDRKGQLNGIPIYWLTCDNSWAVSEMHREAVERFWALFASEEGAVLCTMTSDVAAAFDYTVRREIRPFLNVLPHLQDRGLTMCEAVSFRRQATPVSPAPPNAPHTG